jgi:hypothetical protein
MFHGRIVLLIILILLVLVLLLSYFRGIGNDVKLNIKDFQDFDMPGAYNISTLEKALITGEYEDRMFYNLFNQLNWPGTRPSIDCVNNKDTFECLYFYSILNNREDLCKYFPEERNMTMCGKYGCNVVIAYYKTSCIYYVHLYQEYAQSKNKLEFCNSFSKNYIKEECKTYTCSSEFLKSVDRPLECSTWVWTYYPYID